MRTDADVQYAAPVASAMYRHGHRRHVDGACELRDRSAIEVPGRRRSTSAPARQDPSSSATAMITCALESSPPSRCEPARWLPRSVLTRLICRVRLRSCWLPAIDSGASGPVHSWFSNCLQPTAAGLSFFNLNTFRTDPYSLCSAAGLGRCTAAAPVRWHAIRARPAAFAHQLQRRVDGDAESRTG